MAQEPLHETRFPGESGEYRDARDALLRAEIDLRRAEEAVAVRRRELPLGGEVPTDYIFDSAAGAVTLSELFGDKDTLFLYSFMFLPEGDDPLGRPCPSCTSIIDAVDGEAQHLESMIAIAASAKVPAPAVHGACGAARLVAPAPALVGGLAPTTPITTLRRPTAASGRSRPSSCDATAGSTIPGAASSSSPRRTPSSIRGTST